ncbi:MAG: hypothetical protein KDA85_03885, partial [Planctomycetaceae bacterium]|nr:hypothetical protein [Planctomycetaceae bacterium]
MNVRLVCDFRRLKVIAAILVATAAPPALDETRCDDVATAEAAARDAAFTREVLPILKEHCFECHSHDAKKALGGLVLDSRGGW